MPRGLPVQSASRQWALHHSSTFAVHFDGSDAGLTDNGGEDLDAACFSNGKLLLSTTGSVSVPGVSAADEDVLEFSPSQLGGTTSGSYALLLDLSALGIATSEDIGAVEFRE
jgi:hypothetical protein